MSASLYPGPGSLILNIDTPYDVDGITLRDDIAGVKVWFSTLSASFLTAEEVALNPSYKGVWVSGTSYAVGDIVRYNVNNAYYIVNTTLTSTTQTPNVSSNWGLFNATEAYYTGNSMSINISGLTPGITHWVKYAIISSIDPDAYVVSGALSAVTQSGAQVVDISGYTSFVLATDLTYTPANRSLTATTLNITNPVYAWTISGGTLSATGGQSVTVTPAANSTGVTVTVSVTGSNTALPIAKTVTLPIVYNGAKGQTGTPGSMVAYPTIYRWTTSATPPTRPSAVTPLPTYTWSTGSYTAPTDWTTGITSNTTPGSYLWSITIPLAADADTTVSNLDWSSTNNPIKAAGYNGSNGGPGAPGEYRDVIQLYLTSGSQPTAPTSIPYTFSTNTLGTQTGGTAGWSLTRPAATTTPTYVTTALAATTTPATAVTLTTWSTPVIAAQVGTNGSPGSPGNPGSASFVIDRGAAATETEPTPTEVTDTIGRAAVAGDMAIVSYNNNNGAKNYKFNGSAWILFNTYISGSLIVQNTITADRMVTGLMSADNVLTRGLTVRDSAGNVILSAGNALDFSNVGGTTKPANNATVGAQAGVNLKDTSGTIIADDGFRNNLIDVDWWKRGATIPWTQNAEQNVILTINPGSSGGDVNLAAGPRGGNDLVWFCKEITGNSEQGGGWNANISSTLDPNKTYRFVVPIRIAGTTTNGNAYWGTGNVCDLNTTTLNTNPYFASISRGVLTNDRWYLFVGYVFPYGSTNNSNASAGIWDCKTGAKIWNGVNYCHNTTAANQHRAYQYYAAINSIQFFGRPMINLVDGTEPSLREYFEPSALLNQSITVDSSGILQGTGTDNVKVDNTKITVNADGVLVGTGTDNVKVDNTKITVDGSGILQGTGTDNVKVDNTKITVNADGVLVGTGTDNVKVDNTKIIVNADGVLQGTGSTGVVVDNTQVKIGGVNLVAGTATGVGWSGYDTFISSANVFIKTNTTTSESYINSPYFTVPGNTTITLSFETYNEANVSSVEVYVIPDNYGSTGLLNWNYGKYSSWTKVTQVFTTPAAWGTGNFVKLRFDHNGGSASGLSNLYIKNVKLEYGNKATDWSPANSEIKNSNISISLSSNGTLTGSGGPSISGGVNLSGLGGLSKSTADTLSAVLSTSATTVSGLRAGDLVWDSTGTRTSGKGVAITQKGIVGHNGTKATFNISADTGDATFGGTVEAGLLKSTDNMFVIDLANKFISISV